MNTKYTASIAAVTVIAILLSGVVIVSADSSKANLGARGQSRVKANSWPNMHQNVITDFNEEVEYPSIQDTAFIHPFAVVIGDCYIGKMVMVAPTAVCRGDEGTPIHIGDYSNIQDGVVIHALETTEDGENIDGRRFTNNGQFLLGNDTRFDEGYAVWVGNRTSLAHGVLVHGPAWIGNDTFVGMESMVSNAKVGNNVAIGVSSTITGGITIADNKFVPPGSVITTQDQADALPSRVGTPYEDINEAVIHVNKNLAEQYNKEHLEKLIREREEKMERGMLETSHSVPK